MGFLKKLKMKDKRRLVKARLLQGKKNWMVKSKTTRGD